MKQTDRHQLIIYFLVLLILVSLASSVYAWALGSNVDVLPLIVIAILYMPTPLYALILTHSIRREPINLLRYGEISGLRPGPVAAIVGMFVAWIGLFIGATAAISAFIPSIGATVAGSIDEVRGNIAGTFGAEAAATANLPENLSVLLVVGLAAAIISGFTINLVFALGEEYGWRGYLRRALPGNIWRKHTVIGLVWGAWHFPLIWLGYNYERPGDIVALGAFALFALMMGYVFAYIVERYDNILYAGIFHGMFNGFAGMFAFLLSSHNPLISGPVGLVSGLCFLLIACVLFWRWPISQSVAIPISRSRPPRRR